MANINAGVGFVRHPDWPYVTNIWGYPEEAKWQIHALTSYRYYGLFWPMDDWQSRLWFGDITEEEMSPMVTRADWDAYDAMCGRAATDWDVKDSWDGKNNYRSLMHPCLPIADYLRLPYRENLGIHKLKLASMVLEKAYGPSRPPADLRLVANDKEKFLVNDKGERI